MTYQTTLAAMLFPDRHFLIRLMDVNKVFLMALKSLFTNKSDHALFCYMAARIGISAVELLEIKRYIKRELLEAEKAQQEDPVKKGGRDYRVDPYLWEDLFKSADPSVTLSSDQIVCVLWSLRKFYPNVHILSKKRYEDYSKEIANEIRHKKGYDLAVRIFKVADNETDDMHEHAHGMDRDLFDEQHWYQVIAEPYPGNPIAKMFRHPLNVLKKLHEDEWRLEMKLAGEILVKFQDEAPQRRKKRGRPPKQKPVTADR